MDVWGPARTVRLQLRERFGQDVPVLRLHSDRGGEFSSDLLREFCRGEGITQSFTLPESPQQNGIAERLIGLVMEVARTSMIHAAAPHFLWPFVVRYAAHQLNLWPHVSLPETSPTLRWTRKVGDASVFRFYHPTSRRVLPSQDVTFDEPVPLYRLFPYCSAPPPPPPLFLAPGPPPLEPLPPQGTAPSGVSQVDPLPGIAPVQVAVVSGATLSAASGGAELGDASWGAVSGGAASEGAGSGGAEPEGVEPGGVESEGADSGGAEPRAPFPGEPGDIGARAAAVTTGAGEPTEPGGAGARGAGLVCWRHCAAAPVLCSLASAILGVPFSTGLPPPFLCPPPDQSQPPLQPASPLPVPSPDTEQSGGLTERHEPASCPILPVRHARRAPRLHPLLVPDTYAMALRPSSVPLRVLLPAPPESSLPEVPDPESDRARAASPTVTRLLAADVTHPSFESAAASALVAELLDFAAASRLDYASALVADSVPASPPSVGGECALGTDVLEDRQEDFECLAAAVPRFASMLHAPEGDPDASDIPTPRSYAEAITGPYSSQWQAAMDAEMASWKSTGTYVDEVPPPGVNIVDGMWILRVKRLPGSPHAFKSRYFARGFSQQQGVDYFQTFSPTPKMITLWVLLHVAAQRDYELHSLDFSTPFLQGSLHEEIWLRRPRGFTGSFPAGTQTTLAALGFAPSTANPSLFLRTDTSLPPFYVLVYVDDLVFATADTEALTLVKHRKVHWDAAKRVLRYLCSSSSCEAEIYAGAMAAQELRWLTYLLTDLGEQPCSPPVMYVDNKAMIALCEEHRLEHRTKHIALRYFLAQELQQRGQLRLAYVATRANTSDVFTKALPPGDHQRFVTVLGLDAGAGDPTEPGAAGAGGSGAGRAGAGGAGPTLLMYSPRHFRLVIISASLLG
ncbi:unnamed protein product [Closterium sp. NIES-53]